MDNLSFETVEFTVPHPLSRGLGFPATSCLVEIVELEIDPSTFGHTYIDGQELTAPKNRTEQNKIVANALKEKNNEHSE
mgnify:CR=1 FL=1